MSHPGRLSEMVHLAAYWLGKSRVVRQWVGSVCRYPAILLYHRVLPDRMLAGDDSPARLLGVSASRFEEHLQFLARRFKVISMDDLLSCRGARDCHRHVAITFDDGYRDNIEVALPLLEKYRMPATIYLLTRFLEGRCSMWWYELWELCSLRQTLELTWKGRPYAWRLVSRSEKLACYHDVRAMLISACSFEEQETLLDLARAGRTPLDYRHLCLGWDELRRYRDHPLLRFGAHSHNHLSLRCLSADEVRREMEMSKSLIHSKLDKPVAHFAYPHGTARDAGEREFRLARDCDFRTAVRSEIHEVATDLEAFAIPRATVLESHSTARLHSRLSGWSTLVRQSRRSLGAVWRSD